MIKIMTLADFTCSILSSYYNGNLILDKHDSNKTLIQVGSFRAVVTHEVSGSFEIILISGQYLVNTYNDLKYPNGAGYYELILNPGVLTTFPGYPIPSGSNTTGSAYDR
jgi:hypothetical protein